MSNHRNPQARVSKQAPSDNFNHGDATCEPLLISPHLRLVEIAPGDADARSTCPRRMPHIARMERAR